MVAESAAGAPAAAPSIVDARSVADAVPEAALPAEAAAVAEAAASPEVAPASSGLVPEEKEVRNEQDQQQRVEEHQEEEQPSPLAEGWAEYKDPTTGKPYYYNASTGTTSWERPAAETVAPATRESLEEKPETEEKGESEAVADAVENIAKVEIKESPETKSEGNGELSFAAQVEAEAEAEAEQEADMDSGGEKAGAEASPEGSGAVDASEGKEESPEAASEENQETAIGDANAADSVLPDGWAEAADPSTGNTYYYQAATNQTTWERPVSETKAGDDVEPPVLVEANTDMAGEIVGGEDPQAGNASDLPLEVQGESASADAKSDAVPAPLSANATDVFAAPAAAAAAEAEVPQAASSDVVPAPLSTNATDVFAAPAAAAAAAEVPQAASSDTAAAAFASAGVGSVSASDLFSTPPSRVGCWIGAFHQRRRQRRRRRTGPPTDDARGGPCRGQGSGRFRLRLPHGSLRRTRRTPASSGHVIRRVNWHAAERAVSDSERATIYFSSSGRRSSVLRKEWGWRTIHRATINAPYE